MLSTLLALSLSAAPPSLTPNFYEGHVSAASLGLGSLPGMSTARGVRRIVSGGVLTGLGAIIGIAGVSGLISAREPGPFQLPLTVLGWTGVGIGGVLLLVGVPILVVGIVQVSSGPSLALAVGRDGQLAVTF